MDFPDYGADNMAWVRLQRYRERPWPELLALWWAFTVHLAHVMRSVDPDCLENSWEIAADRSISVSVKVVVASGRVMQQLQGQLN